MSGLDEKGLAEMVARNKIVADYVDDKLGDVRLDYCGHGSFSVASHLADLSAYLSAVGQKAGTAEVKPLEWTRVAKPGSEDEFDEADTPFGGYVITTDAFSYSPTTAYYVDGPNWFKGQFASVTAAKAAAQADYEARIKSALIPALLVAEAAEPVAFKPCVIVNEEAGITEATFEDVPYVAVPVFDGVHHWIDKHVAMDDGRLVGFAVWKTHPAPSPVVPSGLEALVDRLNGVAFMLKTAQTMGEIAVGKGQAPFEVVESAVSSLIAVAAQRDDARKIADTFGREGHELRERVATLIAERDEAKATIATMDRILRATVPEEHKSATSSVGGIQSYVVGLERSLSAALTRIAEIEGAFRAAMAMHLRVNAAQYLLANTRARSNGSLKAHHHAAMTTAYVAALRGVDPDHVRMNHEPDYALVHDKTAEDLTDRMEVIGFDIDGFVEDKLIDKFQATFHDIAVRAIRSSATKQEKAE